jgi:hypothetical protein
MPVPITGGAVATALTEAFALTGKLPLQLDETVVPTVQVGNLEDQLWGPHAIGSLVVPAGGAFRSEVEISVPQQLSGLGVAVIIDAVEVVSLAAQLILLGLSPGLPTPTVFGIKAWKDIGARGLPVLAINGKNTAGPVGGFNSMVRYRVPATRTSRFALGWILRENPDTGLQQGLLMRPGVNDEEINLNFYWRERLPR